MMRKSLIVVTILSAFAYSGIAGATVSAGNVTVSPGATAQSSPITWATRAGVTGAGFDANVVDASNITTGDTFQVTLGNGTFVACDGSERVQADFNTGITCSATGVYSIRTLDNTAIPNLNTNMRVLFDVAAGATGGQTATVEFGPYCTGVQTPASDGCVAFFLADASRQANPTAPTSVNGTITVQSATPPTLTFAPASGTIVSGTSFSITPSGGQAGGSATYTCSPTNAGAVTFTNGAGTINTGGSAVSVTPTCAAAGADQAISCTHTGGAGSTASPVNYTVDCPAVPAPVLASTPPSGTALTCNGAAGSTQTTSVTIQNTGNANMTGVSCNVVGAGFVLTTAPAATIPGPGSSTATVTCTVPADGAAPNTGTLNCTTVTPGGGLTFPLSSVAQSSAIPTQPDIIPASSLWSKLGLIGLLAALGMLAVGFRRQL